MTLGSRHGGGDASVSPAPGRRLEIRPGVFLNLFDEGSGAPILLIHGNAASAYDWGGLPGALAARGARAIRYDRLGYGFSTRVDDREERFTVGAAADDVVALLNALGIARAALLGWSYGAWVSLAVATRSPQRVSHLVLTGAGAPPRRPGKVPWLVASPFGRALARRLARTQFAARMVRAGLSASAGGMDRVPPGTTERFLTLMALPGALEAWALESSRWAETPIRLAAVVAPALVIHGAHDPSAPRAAVDALVAGIVGARLAVIEDGHHGLPVTHVEELVELVAELLGARPTP